MVFFLFSLYSISAAWLNQVLYAEMRVKEIMQQKVDVPESSNLSTDETTPVMKSPERCSKTAPDWEPQITFLGIMFSKAGVTSSRMNFVKGSLWYLSRSRWPDFKPWDRPSKKNNRTSFPSNLVPIVRVQGKNLWKIRTCKTSATWKSNFTWQVLWHRNCLICCRIKDYCKNVKFHEISL